jgi:hypothetical protein
MLGVEEHFEEHCDGKAHVPPVRVELCLEPVLPLLQQSPHLVRYLRQRAAASPPPARRRLVRRCGKQQPVAAARVLAAVGVESLSIQRSRRRRA